MTLDKTQISRRALLAGIAGTAAMLAMPSSAFRAISRGRWPLREIAVARSHARSTSVYARAVPFRFVC